jgi:hypothetical protein
MGADAHLRQCKWEGGRGLYFLLMEIILTAVPCSLECAKDELEPVTQSAQVAGDALSGRDATHGRTDGQENTAGGKSVSRREDETLRHRTTAPA